MTVTSDSLRHSHWSVCWFCVTSAITEEEYYGACQQRRDTTDSQGSGVEIRLPSSPPSPQSLQPQSTEADPEYNPHRKLTNVSSLSAPEVNKVCIILTVMCHHGSHAPSQQSCVITAVMCHRGCHDCIITAVMHHHSCHMSLWLSCPIAAVMHYPSCHVPMGELFFSWICDTQTVDFSHSWALILEMYFSFHMETHFWPQMMWDWFRSVPADSCTSNLCWWDEVGSGFLSWDDAAPFETNQAWLWWQRYMTVVKRFRAVKKWRCAMVTLTGLCIVKQWFSDKVFQIR